MIRLGAYQGLRAHEIAKVRGEDVDVAAGTLYVCGKGGVEAELPLHSAIAEEAARMPATGWWFPSYLNREQPVLSGSVSAVLSGAMARAGVPGTAHSLRHWHATELLAPASTPGSLRRSCGTHRRPPQPAARPWTRASSARPWAAFRRCDRSHRSRAVDKPVAGHDSPSRLPTVHEAPSTPSGRQRRGLVAVTGQ